MLQVLFVCLGNICRSPMAAAVLAHQVAQAGLADQITVASAGTADYHRGAPPHIGTQRVLRAQGISYDSRARQVTAADLASYDYVIALDRENLRDLQALGAAPRGTVALLLSYTDPPGLDVADPYYTGDFAAIYRQISAACARLLAAICAERGLAPRSP